MKHEYKNEIEGNDVAISAHTHRPLKFQNWYFNSGSWTDQTNDFIQIFPDGKVSLFNLDINTPKPNNTEVKSSDIYSIMVLNNFWKKKLFISKASSH